LLKSAPSGATVSSVDTAVAEQITLLLWLLWLFLLLLLREGYSGHKRKSPTSNAGMIVPVETGEKGTLEQNYFYEQRPKIKKTGMA